MASPEDVKGEGFEILDHKEAPGAAPEEPGEAEEQPPGEEEEAPQEPPEPLDVYTVLRVSVAQISGVAWQMLGLHPDPFTGKVNKDLAQARLAIDSAAGLIEKLLPHLQGQEATDYRNLLTDLRMNFVKQSEQPAEDN